MIKSGDALSVKILDNLSREIFMTVNQLLEKLVSEESHNVYSGLSKLVNKRLVQKKKLKSGLLGFKKLIN